MGTIPFWFDLQIFFRTDAKSFEYYITKNIFIVSK